MGHTSTLLANLLSRASRTSAGALRDRRLYLTCEEFNTSWYGITGPSSTLKLAHALSANIIGKAIKCVVRLIVDHEINCYLSTLHSRPRAAIPGAEAAAAHGGPEVRWTVAVTLTGMHHESDVEDAIADEFDDEDVSSEEENGQTISIRRASGEEVLTVWSPGEEWSVYLQPGGGMTNAFVGTPSAPIVWVDAGDRQVERDADGTYVIRID